MAAASRPPSGFHSVTPRIVVSDAAAQVGFLRAVFDAAGEVSADRPAEIRIGDSLVMVTSAGAREPFPAFLYAHDQGRTGRRPGRPVRPRRLAGARPGVGRALGGGPRHPRRVGVHQRA